MLKPRKGPLGLVLEPSGAVLEFSWGQRGPRGATKMVILHGRGEKNGNKRCRPHSLITSSPLELSLGRPWHILGHLELILDPLGCIFGPLGGILGSAWAYLGPSWAHLGLSWAFLGPSWAHIGAILGRLRAI